MKIIVNIYCTYVGGVQNVTSHGSLVSLYYFDRSVMTKNKAMVVDILRLTNTN